MADFFIQEDPSLEHKRQLAQLMMQQGMDSGPIRTNAQSLDRLAKALLGGYQTGQIRRQGEERDRDIAQAFKIAEQDGGTKQLSSLLAGIDPRAAQRVSLQNMQAKEAAAAKKSALEEDRTYTRQTAEDRRLDAFHDKTALGEQTEDRTIAAEDRANAEYDRRKRLDAEFSPKLTPAQSAVDKEFAKEYASFKAGGGYADIEKQITQLEDVSKELAGNKNLSGPGFAFIPDKTMNYTHPDAVNTKELVEEVVQRNLRTILGAQFTEKEGERLIRRAYNQNLKESVNKKRVDALVKQMKSAAKAKMSAMNYYEQYGTLNGWTGDMPSWGDFENLFDDKDDGPTKNGDIPVKKNFKFTPEEEAELVRLEALEAQGKL